MQSYSYARMHTYTNVYCANMSVVCTYIFPARIYFQPDAASGGSDWSDRPILAQPNNDPPPKPQGSVMTQ